MLQAEMQSTFEELYRKNFKRIFNFVYLKLGNLAVAEDITAEVFCKAYEHFNSYDPKKAGEYTWLYAIAKNTVSDYYRRHSKVTWIDYADLPEMPTVKGCISEVLENIITRESCVALCKAVRELPPMHQNVVMCKYVMDLSNKQIAELLQITPSNVSTILNRAISQLRHIMA